MDLKPRKDPGPMQLSVSFLQFNVDLLAPLITQTINTIFQTGCIPSQWKEGYIIPIPKKGSKKDIENYRGIAIQSCVPKIMDRILTRMLYESIGPIIKESQHGFMRGKSISTNLIEMSQLLHNEMGRSQIDVIYFDFSKAFDQIRHDLLAIKLCKLSMPFNFFKIIMKFVLNRSYTLKINGVATNEIIHPRSSVPQGSHFGPILYVIFTNDIDIENILCYADDTKAFRIIRIWKTEIAFSSTLKSSKNGPSEIT